MPARCDICSLQQWLHEASAHRFIAGSGPVLEAAICVLVMFEHAVCVNMAPPATICRLYQRLPGCALGWKTCK